VLHPVSARSIGRSRRPLGTSPAHNLFASGFWLVAVLFDARSWDTSNAPAFRGRGGTLGVGIQKWRSSVYGYALFLLERNGRLTVLIDLAVLGVTNRTVTSPGNIYTSERGRAK